MQRRIKCQGNVLWILAGNFHAFSGSQEPTSMFKFYANHPVNYGWQRNKSEIVLGRKRSLNAYMLSLLNQRPAVA